MRQAQPDENRANLGGVTLPLAQQTVGTGPIRQAAVTYHTALGTYVVFQNGSSLLGYRLGAANPPTINDIWGKSQGGTGSPFVTSTDGTNNIMVWGIGTESSQRLSSFDGFESFNASRAPWRRAAFGTEANGSCWRIATSGDQRNETSTTPS